MKWLRFAARNTLRNRRRSLVAVLVSGLGTAAILLAAGFALYTYEALGQSAARSTGHLIVGTPKMFTEEEDVPLQFGIDNAEKLVARLMRDADVRAVLPRVTFSGLLSNGDKSVVMMGQGVDPASEFRVKGPFLNVTAGDILDPSTSRPQVMVGEGLARSLHLKVGTNVTILATTSAGAMNAVDVDVVGIFATGVPDVDRRLLYVDLKVSQQLLRTPRVSTIGVFLARMEDTSAAHERLARLLPGMTVRTWQDEAVFYTSVRDLYDRIFGSLGVIIAVIVVVVVGNAMSMSIIERTRELSTLRALGTLESQLVRMLTMEGLLLGAAGGLAGVLAAASVSLSLYLLPVTMPPPPGRSTGYPLYVTTDPGLDALVFAGIVILSMAASAWVARKTVRVSIPSGLAHT